LDIFNFLSSSLDNLVQLLLKSGKENFRHTIKYLGDTEFAFRKGVYPYSWVMDHSKFDETSLPPIEAFYNTVNEQALSEEDYRRAREVWTFYKMRTMRDYHDFYLTTDVLLLSDVFSNFRDDVFRKHALDCLYFLTLSALA